MVKLNLEMLRLLMAAKGWTKRDLARHSGVSEGTVYRLVNGDDVEWTSTTLGKLAQALGCGPHDLISGDGYVSPHLNASALHEVEEAGVVPCRP